MSDEKRPRIELTDRNGRSIEMPGKIQLQNPIATLNGRELAANRGTSLNLDWVESVRVNLSAVERRAVGRAASAELGQVEHVGRRAVGLGERG